MSDIAALLRDFAVRYTAAWCSQNPKSVADHFSLSGSLSINRGNPAVGRAAITEVVRSFMTAFPDMQVTMDRLVAREGVTEYHWTLLGTLLGTNTGPGGAGRCVRISGYEVWKIGEDGLIEESEGHFDAALYDCQLQHGVAE